MLPSLAGPQLNERIDEELAREGEHCQTSKRGLVWSPTITAPEFFTSPFFFTAWAIAPFADNIN